LRVVTNRQRQVAFGAIVFFVILVIWLFMRGGGYHVNAIFESGGQLVKGANVTVGGKAIGKVESITLTDGNQANVKMKIKDSSLDPLHVGTTATIRQFSLSGVANRFVALAPGPNSAPKIEDGGVIPADDTEAPVDLDSVLNAFTPKVTKGLQGFIKGSAVQYSDDPSTPLNETTYGNQALRYIAPFFDSGARLAHSVAQDDATLADFLIVSDRATTTLAEQKTQIQAMFTNLTRFTTAVSAESEELDKALAVLPTTLREGTIAFRQLRPTFAALENLSDKSDPIGNDGGDGLASLFRKLKPLIDNSEPTLGYLRELVKQGGANNDLTDLFAGQPSLTKKARTAFPNSTTAMQSAQIWLEFIRPYTPELTSWFSHFGQIAANYDANGHYVRVATQTGNFKLNGSNQLTPSNDKSLSQYGKTGTARCPGSAAQPGADGSNPFTAGGTVDCDSSIQTPGP
jgi:phospholipid/cholesterol/gamma-HCH transport system substrate-binding protein